MCPVDRGRVIYSSSKKDWTKRGQFAQFLQDVLLNINLPLSWMFNKTQTYTS